MAWRRRFLGIREKESAETAVLDVNRKRFPFAIVWTPIHPITWLLPFVGHMGICDSRGVILDFTGGIGCDCFAFGSPTRYLVLNPKRATNQNLTTSPTGVFVTNPVGPVDVNDVDDHDDHDVDGDEEEDWVVMWDNAVLMASDEFEKKVHCMICGPDCHSHVARALNIMGYGGCRWWNKVALAAWVFFCARHTSCRGVAYTWGPFFFIALVIIAIHTHTI